MTKKKAAAEEKPEVVKVAGKTISVVHLARVCHEANRAYCYALGDSSQLPWNDAPEWQIASAVAGVKFHLAHPDSQPQDSHEAWLKEKKADGWKFGPVKDAAKKEHPCFVPFEELPVEQQAKDVLFVSIVRALEHLIAR